VSAPIAAKYGLRVPKYAFEEDMIRDVSISIVTASIAAIALFGIALVCLSGYHRWVWIAVSTPGVKLKETINSLLHPSAAAMLLGGRSQGGEHQFTAICILFVWATCFAVLSWLARRATHRL
jgi:hypothetical protein